MSRLTHNIGRNRIFSVDVLKGFAMVLVILQHSYLSVNMKSIPPLFDFFTWNVTGLAAVAFVSISGMMYSYFLYTHTDWRLAYHRYARRAAFLLLAAHPVINVVSYYFNAAGKQYSSSYEVFLSLIVFNFPITDMIALCLLMAPVFIIGMGHLQRSVAISAMLLSAVFIRASVIPVDLRWSILQEITFGGLGVPMVFWFPLIPWLAIFLSGSFAGYALACHKKGSLEVSAMVKMINRGGLLLAVCGVVLTIGYKMLKIAFGGDWSPNLFLALYPGQTTALLPGYLAVLALLFAVLVQQIDISVRYNRLFWLLSILGRTSLFTYVVQFAVVESVPAILGFKGTLTLAGFFILFSSGLVVVWILAYLYGRLRNWFSPNDYAEFINTARVLRQSA